MTSPMIVRSDQCRMPSTSDGSRSGCRTSWPSQRAQRGTRPPPGVPTVDSSAMRFDPAAYRTGSTWVCGSG